MQNIQTAPASPNYSLRRDKSSAGDINTGEATMKLQLFQRAILTESIPEESLEIGDVKTVVGNSLWNGLAEFTQEHGALTIDSFDQLPELPHGKALISIPSLPHGEEELARLREFVTRGGTVILMDDFG
jgi:hypothetical protein